MDYILTLFFQVLLLLLLMMLTSIITWMRLEMSCQICLNGLLFLNGEWISNVARALTLGMGPSIKDVGPFKGGRGSSKFDIGRYGPPRGHNNYDVGFFLH